MDFYIFLFSPLSANPRAHLFYCMNIVVCVFSHFSENSFFHENKFRNAPKFYTFFVTKFHEKSCFFGIDSRIDFFIVFWWKTAPKMDGNLVPGETFWLPFRDLFRASILGCILVAPWLTFGSLLGPLGCLLAPFGSLLAPFGSRFAHFWCPLAHFWSPWAHFCSPWRSIFSLLGSHGGIFNIFGIFDGHLM